MGVKSFYQLVILSDFSHHPHPVLYLFMHWIGSFYHSIQNTNFHLHLINEPFHELFLNWLQAAKKMYQKVWDLDAKFSKEYWITS